ncbi:hypothetical protein LR48_Vigan04g137800 [Vigna angularis]|uniref:Uncharacterized protein n=1 Tax=Phaseolus angularis TaxID=3914 RepID=A0A0L9UE13_PHAAN|nr:hypothetical protein LR48_Vigan04g137800 [Vigna angularis]
MTGQGSKRPDKGKGLARPRKRQQQAPKYPPTPAVDPTPTSAIHPYPTPVVHPSPTSAAHHSTTPTADPLPPPVIITPTPPPVVITSTPLPDPTSIPSSSCIPPSETVTPSADPDSSGDGEGLDPPLHDRPWIEPYGLFHLGLLPRPSHEEFSTRLSQVRSEHESAPTPDDGSNAEDDIRRTQCWIDIVGGKKKGRVYGAGQLAANYTTSRGGTLKHQPSSSTTAPHEVVLRLTQALEQRDQEITDLRAEFTNFKALVMRVLPGTSQDEFNIPPTQPRPSSSPAVPQQPTSVQPSSVQPTPVQPSI